jgi:hypothetical protein
MRRDPWLAALSLKFDTQAILVGTVRTIEERRILQSHLHNQAMAILERCWRTKLSLMNDHHIDGTWWLAEAIMEPDVLDWGTAMRVLFLYLRSSF